jgi:hypothetical protein
MEAKIRDAAPLDLAKATDLAADPEFVKAGVTARGIAAKARTMGVEYHKQERVSKDGSAVAKKEDLVERIEAAFGVKVPSLAKAEKNDLKKLVAAIAAATEDADETVAA